MKTLLACATLAIALVHAQDSNVSSRPAGPIRWAEGAPNATSDVKNDAKIEGLKTDDVHIYVSLADIKETEYNRVWVQVSNHSKSAMDFDPQAAILLNGDKTVRAEVPDKAAHNIQKFGEAKSQELASAHCNQMMTNPTMSPNNAACQPTNTQMQMSKQVLTFSNQQAQWVRDNGLVKKELAPDHEIQGAVVFKKDKKKADYILKIQVGSQTFEFPLSAQNKAPSYD